MPPAEPGALLDDWKQRAAVVQGYRELAGITDPAVAIGPAPARQAGMSEAFAASVHALALPDDTALLKAMGHGELEARVRAYARAEAIAPPDVQADIKLSDSARQRYLKQAETARDAGDQDRACQAQALTRILTTDRERLQVADAARREWEEATAAAAAEAEQARAELSHRGSVRWSGTRLEAAKVPEEQAELEQADPAAPEGDRDISGADLAIDAEAEAWPEAQADMGADVHPGALAVMATVDAELAAVDDSTFDEDLACARAGAERLAEKRARDQAERERAAIDEPVVQAELEASAAADVQADTDAELEI